jgi:acetylornithine/N-succinyldiaminopimelate aminotransferase
MKSPLLRTILQKGSKAISARPKYLDEVSYAGHHDIGLIDFEKSHGPYLINAAGATYLDLTAFWNTNALDPNQHPALTKADFLEHLGRLGLAAPTASEMVSAEQAAFVKMMQEFWPAARWVLTASTGALAVNDACWTAATIVAEKVGLQPREMKGIVFAGAFHGRHDRGADATAPTPKVAFRQIPHRFIRCPSPVMVLADSGKALPKETKRSVAASLAAVEAACQKKETAYLIMEYPFQAEGGAQLAEPGILKKFHRLCRQYGKLLIIDCVQMGGRVWTELDGGLVSPFPAEALQFADLITFGKVFRVSGFMSRNPLKLSRGFTVDPIAKYPERYGSTWVGGLVQMAAGVAVMEIIRQKKLWQSCLRQTKTAYDFLIEMAKKYEGTIVKPRGRLADTAFLGWDFADAASRNDFLKIMREDHHILMLGASEKSIRWAPFLDMGHREMARVLKSIESALEELARRNLARK